MKQKCCHCDGSGMVEVSPPPKMSPCLDCGSRKLELKRGEGWFCKNCGSGGYLVTGSGLVRK